MTSRLLLCSLLAVLAGGALSGCDDHVIVDRDSTIPIRKGMTWAWRPQGPPSRAASANRAPSYGPSYGNAYQRNPDWEHDIVRNRIAQAFEQALNARGLVEVSDPGEADFLADYQFAVQQRHERVASPMYTPGLVCGYYGCSNGFYGPPGMYLHTVQYHQGTIAFDFFDQGSHRLAYRAVRENVVNKNSYSDDEVRAGVKHLLKGLKPN